MLQLLFKENWQLATPPCHGFQASGLPPPEFHGAERSCVPVILDRWDHDFA